MSDSSPRQQLLEAVRERLSGISTADGYHTDAGRTVYFGEAPMLSPGDEADTAILLRAGPDEVTHLGANVTRAIQLQIAALARADLSEPWVAAERVLADVQRIIESSDRAARTLGERAKWQGLEPGQIDTLEREEGATTVAVEITYTATYTVARGGGA